MDYKATRKKKLVDYFQKNFVKGYTPDALQYALINQGYSRSEVIRALEIANQELAKKAPVLKEKPQITYNVIGENDSPVQVNKPWWKRWFGF